MPLDPELSSTLQATSQASLSFSSAMSNCTFGSRGSIKVSTVLTPTLLQGCCSSTQCVGQSPGASTPACHYAAAREAPWLNLGLEINLFLDPFSPSQSIIFFLQRMPLNWARPLFSSSPACLYWHFRLLSSCLMLWILTSGSLKRVRVPWGD